MHALIRNAMSQRKARTGNSLYCTTGFATLSKEDVSPAHTNFTLFSGKLVMSRHLVVTCTLIFILLCGIPAVVPAAGIIELPVLAAIQQNNLGVFEILMMWWDRKSEPNPVQLQWLLAGVRLGNDHLGAMAQAFAYAVERTPSIQHNGTVSVQGVAYRPTGSDGPSAGAAMAVGFIALFKGEHIQRGIALTGTIEPGG
jgi:Lon-like protease